MSGNYKSNIKLVKKMTEEDFSNMVHVSLRINSLMHRTA